MCVQEALIQCRRDPDPNAVKVLAIVTEALPHAPPTRALTLELLHLSYPLLLTNLSGVLIGTTDTLFMGQLGTSEVAAVGLGSVMFWTLFLLPRGSSTR